MISDEIALKIYHELIEIARYMILDLLTIALNGLDSYSMPDLLKILFISPILPKTANTQIIKPYTQ